MNSGQSKSAIATVRGGGLGAGPRFLRYGILILLFSSAWAWAAPVQMCSSANRVAGDAVCGDGKCQADEVCDDGPRNSDYAPDRCRPDTCRYAYCGDGVQDSGEQCDEGLGRALPGRCRPDCLLPRCGDGTVDAEAPYGEQCDDRNGDETDGCLTTCRTCIVLADAGNIEITEDTQLCGGEARLDDYGDYGAVIIKRSGITLDCNGLKLVGEGRGVGVMIFRSNDVTIRDCDISGFETGIKGEDSDNVTLIGNTLCGNSVLDIELPGTTRAAGGDNACQSPGDWNDTGVTGCTRRLALCNAPTTMAPGSAVVRPAASAQRIPAARPAATRPAQAPAVVPASPPEATRPVVKPAPRDVAALSSAPDLAIVAARFTSDCRRELRLENRGAPLGEALYGRGGVVLQRFEDDRPQRRVPLARVDGGKRLAAGEAVDWIDADPLRARKAVGYRLLGLAAGGDADHHSVTLDVPAACRAD